MENPFEQIYQKLNRIEKQLENLNMSISIGDTPKNSDLIGGIDLAVEITGLARPTIYSLSCKNEIPHFKKHKKLYFSRTELISWIKSGRRKTRHEIIHEAELKQINSLKKRNHKVLR